MSERPSEIYLRLRKAIEWVSREEKRMSVIIDTSMHEVEALLKYARYGANNCMIGNGWEIRELVRCKDCKHRPIKPDNYNSITTDGFALEFPDEKCPCQCSDGWYSKYPDDDWFCPNGERRSE